MPSPFVFDGQLLCLDLVNTRLRRDGRAVDLLEGFEDLARWLVAAGAVPEETAGRALERWRGSAAARECWRSARELRDAVRRIADRMIAGEAVEMADAVTVDRVLGSVPTVWRLVAKGERRVIETRAANQDPAALLLAPARSAAELLAELDPSRVGRCAAAGCVLYFYDTTKSRSRKWCSMARCGSRAKAAAYYRRRRRTGGADG